MGFEAEPRVGGGFGIAGGTEAPNRDQPFSPAEGKHRRIEIHSVDAEAVESIEVRELPDGAAQERRHGSDLGFAFSDREDVDLDRHRCRRRKLGFPKRAEDRLGADDDHLSGSEYPAGGPDRVFELFPPHQAGAASASRRSLSERTPLNGETSLISMLRRSSPVSTRLIAVTFPPRKSSSQRSRFAV